MILFTFSFRIAEGDGDSAGGKVQDGRNDVMVSIPNRKQGPEMIVS